MARGSLLSAGPNGSCGIERLLSLIVLVLLAGQMLLAPSASALCEAVQCLLTPAIEYGKRLALDEMVLLYWFSAGVNLLPNPSWLTRSHAESEPDVTVTEKAALPAAIGDFRAGILLASHKGWSAHADYALQTASHYRSQTGTLRLMLEF